MLHLLRFFAFLCFLFLGARIRLSASGGRRRAIQQFLVYVLAVSWAVGMLQRDAWPFSPYPLMRGIWDGDFVYEKVVPQGLDADGREWPIDPLSWSPLFPLVLNEWILHHYPRLSPPEQVRVAEFFLERAENARARRAANEPIGPEVWLGRLAAPDWWLYRPATAASPRPFTGIRIYLESWQPRRRLADPQAFSRRLLLEHHAR
jgi:hypothetical protein